MNYKDNGSTLGLFYLFGCSFYLSFSSYQNDYGFRTVFPFAGMIISAVFGIWLLATVQNNYTAYKEIEKELDRANWIIEELTLQLRSYQVKSNSEYINDEPINDGPSQDYQLMLKELEDAEAKTTLIPWYPENLAAPAELTSVLVPRGKLDEKDWLEALSNRVVELALKEENPLEASNLACRRLGLPSVDSPEQLGEALVKYNLNLVTHLSLAQIADQWPSQVSKPLESAKDALRDSDLDLWVELALSQVSASSLD